MLDNTLFHPRSPGTPLQAWIRQSLVNAIVDGKLHHGQRMPATRHLAKSLGVGRNTVTAAYEELVSQGFLESRERMGFFVGAVDQARGVEAEPNAASGQGIAWRKHLKFMPSEMRHIEKPWDWQQYRYPFVYGQVDRNLFPIDQWRACSRDALGRSAIDWWASDRALDDDPLLVEQLCRHVLPQRGIYARRDEVMVTLGSQHGIYLLARLLLHPGDGVAVEDPGYPDAQNIFAAHRADVRHMPVDDDGMILNEQTEAMLKGAGLVFVTPAHHCPTMVTLSDDRRARLLDLADRDDFLILEDDYEGEIRNDKTPPALKSIDQAGRVVYIGTMSKVLAPGVRIGYVVAPAPLVAELRALRRLMHRSAPLNNQRTAAILLANGHYEGMVRGLREALSQRWQEAVAAARRDLPDFRLSPSIGGSSLWLECPADIHADDLIEAAGKRGVLVERGDPFVAPDLAGRFFRLGLSAIDVHLIAPGIAEIAAAARDVRRH
ncbi:MocR-like pyridoxine biosynthesis transcription factor PdxR [Chachezhania sediminis]|uniref:MocR-like pyridoxine biosynthesis transcription factor PdxR n=1 Tax=Chachezhania sediminis TaxID=2599291 RepID=UPI00131DDBF5|nr:PLP-dependent aminotransferase family protein [Chachezhania sediminis]